jgi:hypothetical protein
VSTDTLGALWVIGCVALAILLANWPLIFGVVISIPWFWFAWTAAEQGAPFVALVLFIDGAGLLWLCGCMHRQRVGFAARATP